MRVDLAPRGFLCVRACVCVAFVYDGHRSSKDRSGTYRGFSLSSYLPFFFQVFVRLNVSSPRSTRETKYFRGWALLLSSVFFYLPFFFFGGLGLFVPSVSPSISISFLCFLTRLY